jgi:hypothetical protein
MAVLAGYQIPDEIADRNASDAGIYPFVGSRFSVNDHLGKGFRRTFAP